MSDTIYYITRYILEQKETDYTPIYRKKTYEITFEKKYTGVMPIYKEIPVDGEIITEGFKSYLRDCFISRMTTCIDYTLHRVFLLAG